VLVSFNRYIAVGSGVRYIQKNYRYERDFLDGVVEYSDYTNGFVQVPVFAEFSVPVSKRGAFSFDLGATFGGWAHSGRKGVWEAFQANPYKEKDIEEMFEFDEKVEFDGTKDNRFESAIFAGIGFKYTYKFLTPFVIVQYHYGLTDLQKDYMTNQVARYNNTVTVQFGALFNINSLLGRSK